MPHVELEHLMSRRREPNAGLYVALTQRCPMSCAHCSTNSSLRAPHELPAAPLEALFDGMTEDEHPAFALFTGGEPLIRASLLGRLASRIRALGGASYAITGGYWVRSPPPAIVAALDALDLVSFSYDRFHAAEVARDALFDGIQLALDRGCAVAVQTVRDPAAPDFTRAFLDALGDRFAGRVPVYVSPLSPHGRARSLAVLRRDPRPSDSPCLLASWPVIAYTGWVVACCQHEVIDGAAPPEHLRLGRLGETSWAEIAERNRARLALRAVRCLGPAAFGASRSGAGGYCGPCLAFDGDDDALPAVLERGRARLIERLLEVPGLLPTPPIDRPGAP